MKFDSCSGGGYTMNAMKASKQLLVPSAHSIKGMNLKGVVERRGLSNGEGADEGRAKK